MHLGFQSNWRDTCWEWFGCLSNFFTGHTTLCSTWWVLEADRSSRQATRGHGMVAFTGSHLSWEPWHWLNTGVLFSFFLCRVSVAVWEKKLGSTLVLDEMFLQNQVLLLEQETYESAGHDIFWFHILLLQGHWPFPRDKIMMGYAYILTHPGTVRQPCIFLLMGWRAQQLS
jgi:hypothetical protein